MSTDQENMPSCDDTTRQDARKISLAEKARLARKLAYQKAKEQKKRLLATPEMQARIAAQKARLKAARIERSQRAKNARKVESKTAKQELSKAQQSERQKRQSARDDELMTFVKPALMLIQGGQDP